MSILRRTLAVTATLAAAGAASLVNASPALASTPSSCSSVRQIGTTRVLTVGGTEAASVKQYLSCGARRPTPRRTAPTSPATSTRRAVQPARSADVAKPTVANLQYDLLAGKPFVHTQEDVLFASWFERQDMPARSAAEIAELREDFFAKPKPCLRTSPLAKRYGWGFLFDAEGGVKLCPMESAEYRELSTGGKVKVLKAMRSSR